MKALRVLLWCVGILAAVAALVVAVALNASFQTWMVQRALRSRPALHGDVGRVAAGFGGITLRDVRLESHGAVLTLPALDADCPILAAGLRRRVALNRVTAKGWVLDLTHAPGVPRLARALLQPSPLPALQPGCDFSLVSCAQAAAPAGAPVETVFRGLFTAAQLPVDLAVGDLDLEGEVILPGTASEPAVHVRIAIRGGHLAAGSDGRFVADAVAPRADGGSLAVHAIIGAKMDTPRTFTEFSLRTEATASGTQFPRGVKLVVDAVGLRTGTGERYTGIVSGESKQLAALQGDLTQATSHIGGTWKLDVHDSDLAPFALGRKLPVFAAAGDGGFETDTRFQEVHVRGQLNASAEHLETVRVELGAIGAARLVAQFDLLHHGQSIRVERLDATITGAKPVATIRALQPFELNVASGELSVADPARDLIGITVEGIPLAWAQPLLGDLAVSGGDLRGDLAAKAGQGGLTLRPRSPLTVAGLSVSQHGEPLVKGLDVSANISADYVPAGWQVQIADATVRSGGATLLQLEARAGRLLKETATKATGRWSADLAALTAQPAFAESARFTHGEAKGEFSGSVDGTTAIEAKLLVTGLVAMTGEKLPAITTELRADVAENGRVTFRVPLVFELGGRTSDIQASGTLKPAPQATAIEARIASENIVVEDVKLLALAIPNGEAAPAPKPATADTGPFWSKLSGQVSLALKKVVYNDSFVATDVGGTLRIDASALSLENIRAGFAPDGDLKLSGGATFDAKRAQPYAIALDAALNNFDTGPAFHAIDPTKLPTLEARVNLSSHITGTGRDLGTAAGKAKGDVQITGRSGIFRALSADMTDKVQKTQSTVAAIGGLIGAVTGKKEYVDFAAKTQIMTDIAKALSEIPFDQLNVVASRDAGLNFALKDFTLISPEIRLTGGGGIQFQEGVSVLQQPLALQLQLGARGRLGELLKRAGLLENKQDNLGYRAFVSPINITGSLAKTDTGELIKTLLSSTLLK